MTAAASATTSHMTSPAANATSEASAAARSGAEGGARRFETATEPWRREILAHCYRMLASLHDAEDAVQETYLRAWRGFGDFEERSSVRTWLHRIATNVCLTAAEQRSRRPLPTGLGQPASDPTGALERREDVTWLEPLPDAMLSGAGGASDPAEVAALRDSVRLAFVAALQHLTAAQRAALLLRDVVGLSAEEAAAALGQSVGATTSALQRARATVRRLDPAAASDAGTERASVLGQRERELLARYVAAFEAYDIDAVVTLLSEEVTWQMPPFTGWYAGPPAVASLVRTHCPARAPGDMRFAVTGANGVPAAAAWMRHPDGVHRAFQLHVLEPSADRACVRAVTCFFDTRLFARFGLPQALPPDHEAGGDPRDAGVGAVWRRSSA